MPTLWTETVAAHRAAVSDAVLDTAAALAAERGAASVTMTEIAGQVGITRATLYKYYRDVEAILVAWHQRTITRHLEQLAETAAEPGTPGQRLQAVLKAYATRITHEHPHDSELIVLMHRREHVAAAERQLCGFLTALLADAAEAGEVRRDVPPDELANFCLHALAAATTLPSADAVGRVVALTVAGLRPDALKHPGPDATDDVDSAAAG